MKATPPSQASRIPIAVQFTATKCQHVEANLFISSTCLLEGKIIAIVTDVIDLANYVFAVRAVNATGKVLANVSF